MLSSLMQITLRGIRSKKKSPNKIDSSKAVSSKQTQIYLGSPNKADSIKAVSIRVSTGHDPSHSAASNGSGKSSRSGHERSSRPIKGARTLPTLNVSPWTSTTSLKQPTFNSKSTDKYSELMKFKLNFIFYFFFFFWNLKAKHFPIQIRRSSHVWLQKLVNQRILIQFCFRESFKINYITEWEV